MIHSAFNNRLPVDYTEEFQRTPLNFLVDIARGEKPTFFRLGQENVYFLNDPDYIEDVLVTHQQQFIKILGFSRARDLMGKGLFSRRVPWPDSYVKYELPILQYGIELRDEWSDGNEIDILSEMKNLNFKIMAKTLCQEGFESVVREYVDSMDKIIDSLNSFTLCFPELLDTLPANSERSFHHALQFLDNTIYTTLKKNSGSLNLQNQQVSKKQIEPLNNADTIDQRHVETPDKRDKILTTFLAGYEQISCVLAWTWYLLSQHSESEQKLHNEIDNILCGKPPSIKDISRLRFTAALLNEVLRLYPPVWVLARRALCDCKIRNVTIPANSVILMSQYTMHRDARYFESPSLFLPERWSSKIRVKHPLFAYFPFSHGPRKCKGEQFVILETLLLIATIAQKWRIRFIQNYPVEPDPKITLRPKFRMRMVLERRI